MHASSVALERLSDAALIQEVARCAGAERHATARLVGALGELDARRLYLAEGCSSLFTYCTQCLRLSEHAAYGRIEAARAARRFPMVLDLLAEGAVTLTSVGLLAPHLTTANHAELLESARHRSKREVEEIVARLRPRPDAPSRVRKLPAPTTRMSEPPAGHHPGRDAQPPPPAPSSPSGAPAAFPRSSPARQPAVAALAPERYRIQITVDRATHDKLRRAQDLLRQTVPDGDPAVVFDRALTVLLEHLEKAKLGAARQPRKAPAPSIGSRHIPSAVKRAVWKRDEGRCAFVGPRGRGGETGFLEFHHVQPYAEGGEATVENISLRCRGHNTYEAEQWFGPMVVREGGIDYLVQLGPARVGVAVPRELRSPPTRIAQHHQWAEWRMHSPSTYCPEGSLGLNSSEQPLAKV